MLVYLMRTPGQRLPREVLADLFWGDATREKAVQSLRQALRQLRKIEPQVGLEFLETGNLHIAVDCGKFDWDLTALEEAVSRGQAEDFQLAQDLWKGEFLYGFEALDREFDSWLLVERERIRSDLISSTLEKISAINGHDDGERVEAAGRFLLHMDAASENGHQILIKSFLAKGQRERAQEQLKTCERELRANLDAEPDPETYRLFDEQSGNTAEVVRPGSPAAGIETRGVVPDDGGIQLPEVSILSLSLNASQDVKARTLRDEITSGLSSYRSFELRQAEYETDESANSVVRADGGELGSYLLRFREDATSNRIYIQFEDRDSGRIVFNDIVDLGSCSDIQATHSEAFQTVSRIHAYVLGRLRRPVAKSPFAKWCQAEALIWEFSPSADEKALRLLRDLETTHSTFSMTYAGMASISMKKLLYYPDKKGSPLEQINDILAVAERGVNLDPWQSVNQRVYGWALVQSGYREDACKSFKQAEKLSPLDPSNLMSVAEGLAFSGDAAGAREIADRAYSLFAVVPRFVYEYLGNIHFAAEDYSSAVDFVERGPTDSIFGLTTRIASLLCTGRESEAKEVLQTIGSRFKGVSEWVSTAEPGKYPWNQRVNFFQDLRTRENYKRGADMVQSYLKTST